MRLGKLGPAVVATTSLLALAPAAASAHKHPSPLGRCPAGALTLNLCAAPPISRSRPRTPRLPAASTSTNANRANTGSAARQPIRALTERARPCGQSRAVYPAALACARALGEAIMIFMVSGERSFTPNLDHGPLIFLYEPLRTLASVIVDNKEGFGGSPAVNSTSRRSRSNSR